MAFPTISHNPNVSFKLASLNCDFRLILVDLNQQKKKFMSCEARLKTKTLRLNLRVTKLRRATYLVFEEAGTMLDKDCQQVQTIMTHIRPDRQVLLSRRHGTTVCRILDIHVLTYTPQAEELRD